MHKKNICFFSGDITRSGGTERVAIMIANELVHKEDLHICFLSITEQQLQPFFPLDKKISHTALSNHWINPGPEYLKILPKIRQFFKRNQIDVVVDIDIVLDVLSLPASTFQKTKVISWDHFNFDFEMSILYRKFILKYITTKTDYIITLTKENQRSYQNILKRTKHITTIYNPIEMAQENEKTPRNPYILSVGRLEEEKGLDYMIEVARHILPKYPDWKWFVLGDGSKRSYMEEKIQTYHLQNQLILTGTVKNVTDYLKESSLFVLTSKREGLPMCLLEAKAYHLPCISFDIQTGPSEIIRDNVDGFLIEPFHCKQMQEHIELLINNASLRDDFSRNSATNLGIFQMDHILEQWFQILKSV